MESTSKSFLLFLTRISMGWIFFYAGLTKILNPSWSAAGYLNKAQSFPDFFAWFASPQNIGWVNLLNEWGLAILGVSLILGLFVRFSSFFGILLMVLYYIPILSFPFAGANSYIIDEHIIYILVLLILISSNAGKYFGLDKFFSR